VRRAVAALMELQGLKMVEVHHAVMELRKTHAAVGRNLAEVRAAAGQRGNRGGSSVRAFSCHAPLISI
jgi:hypothetical protein